MKVKIVYDADGTCELIIKAYCVSTQVLPGTCTALIKVYNKKNKITRTYQFSKVYWIEKII